LGLSNVCVDFNLWFFDRFAALVLFLNVDEFIIVGSFEQLMLWCKKKLAHKFDMKAVGVWQVANEVFLEQGDYTLNILKRFQIIEGSNGLDLHSFRFTGGKHYDKALVEGKFKMLREYLGLMENTFLADIVLIFVLLLQTCSTFIFNWMSNGVGVLHSSLVC
jgi:hypothetical protein